jgi:glycosyltransferase involved in cell wall biosynthesis
MDFEKALKSSILVIPSINGCELLKRMLPSVRFPGENIIIIDQGSTDDTEKFCRSRSVTVLQTGRQHTYTEACNIGAQIARQRGCEFLFVGNNDIFFVTDVLRECVAELVVDPDLGIVAPAQILIDQNNRELKANRAFWNLTNMAFEHDFSELPAGTRRLEADFCELTLAGVRVSAIEKIGFLDDEYGFYREDADFGYRLRKAGYTCAYLPQSIIKHWVSSTFNNSRAATKAYYIKKNKRVFAKKFLNTKVYHKDYRTVAGDSWARINRHLASYLNGMGMVDDNAPELTFSHPGGTPYDYLYTVWETTKLPQQWLQYRDSYKAVMTTSRWGAEVLKDEGYENVHYAPLGVESDIFQPWGPVNRRYERKTFFWLSHNQYRKGLDVMLRAWDAFHKDRPLSLLILMGAGVRSKMSEAAEVSRRWLGFEIQEFVERGISVYEIVDPVSDLDLAAIYRGVDFTICSSRSEGFGFVVVESMACGKPVIHGNYGGTRDFTLPGGLTFQGDRVRADYSDKGFEYVGDWWEPRHEELVARMIDAFDMRGPEYEALSSAGVRLARTHFSWRTTCFALQDALEKTSTFLDRSDRAGIRPVGAVQTSSAVGEESSKIPAVLFIGYAEGNLGLGQAFREDILAAVDARLPLSIYPFRVGVETRIIGPFMPHLYDTEHLFPINVVEVAADQIPVVIQNLPPTQLKDRYNIFRTYWELPSAPVEWRDNLRHFNEIWAPNEFVADAFRDIFDGVIHIIPPPVDVMTDENCDRAAFGMSPGRFYFMFNFDYYSSPYRKNPTAVLEAFERAFVDRGQNVGLVVKSIGPSDNFPDIKNAFDEARARDPRIILIDRTLQRQEMLRLIQLADCYISLHRSEGFGLGMAEAMYFGKAVIGTNFSGSRCFLNERTGYPVPFTLRNVEPHEYPYSSGQVWAEPNIAEAAALMRKVLDEPEDAARRAAEGQKFVEANFSRNAIGRVMKLRLREVRRSVAFD